MHHQALIDRYLAGSDLVASAVAGMTADQVDAKPIPGKWSTRQVVCHLADFEPIYMDRMKRVIAERCPTFFGGDPDTFAAGLAYDHRTIDGELALITAVLSSMASIVRVLKATDFQHTGNHSEVGLLTLEQLLTGITDHIPHRIHFITEKRRAVGI